MGKWVIETDNLTFGYNKRTTVFDKINLRVETAAIYGFMGPNGAGKTTLIRLLLGLLPHHTGGIMLFGKPLKGHRLEILSKTGCLVEQPSLYENLTGRDNLSITCMIRGLQKDSIDRVLHMTGLRDAANKRVDAYSQGMKQRLGLAIALLPQPELLILDEPVNGLDPLGIIEIRELLIHLNKEYGTTIFLSSHLLSELEKLVTHTGILRKGELIFQGSAAELEAIQQQQSTVMINTDNNQGCLQLLKQDYPAVSLVADRLHVPYEDKETIGDLCQRMVLAGFRLYEVKTGDHDLENIFMKLTSN
ncbi:ABC transporter ATP-binding protein [Chitinophaga sp. Ak27]|uniref:ABC transporter ATP-binding protein n=1 Tax=Chitinophaga sp. Ak27 TaxID=2726116 RepID=UPI00145E1BBA|nr:ATP-binding cassette domain-containing protein [Chitinophaga sp. Ak27]NLU93322.1 ATP-binding cassette domain-containing protein [Chitinophaga sp. Ak27]